MMLSVETAIGELRRRCADLWLHWALGQDGPWPLKLTLKAPQGTSFDDHVIAATAWAGTWRSAIDEHRIPGRLITAARRARRLGTHELPITWVIDDLDSALAVADPEIVASYELAAGRFAQALATPEIAWNMLSDIPFKSGKTIAGLDDAEWATALTVVTHLVAVGPGDATVLRQIRIPGVHSKWIEQNATLLCAMLGTDTDSEGADPLTRLIARLGLDAKQTRLQVTLACPKLRAHAAGLRRFHATIPILNDTVLAPAIIVIVENEAPGQTLDLDLGGVAVIGGLGKAAPILAQLNWIHIAERLVYWGDIDRAGISILASVRRAGLPVSSILMDETVLDAHRSAWHTTATQQATDTIPVELTDTEAALYQRLNAYHHEHGRELQLEQEHLPKPLVDDVIRESTVASADLPT